MKYYIPLFLIFAFISCKREMVKQADPASLLVVTGQMEGGAGMKLFFGRLSEFGREGLDTVVIDKHGIFNFNLAINSPGFYQLSNEGGNSISLVCNPGDSLNVESNYFNFREYKLSGSKDLEQIEILHTKTRSFLEEMSHFAKIIEDSINSPDYRLLRLEIDRKYKESFNNFKSFSKNFILENEKSLVSLLALTNQIGEDFYVFHPTEDLYLFQKVDSMLFPIFPEENSVVNLHKQMLVLKQEKTSQKLILQPGDKIPDVSLPDAQGKLVNIAEIKTKRLLIDFWATWCTDCIENNNGLKELYDEYHTKGFEIVQISIDDSKEAWIKAIEGHGNNWIHLNDLKFWEGEAVQKFNVEKIPFSLLINENNEIISFNINREKLKMELNYIFDK